MADTGIPLKSVVLLSLPSATPGPPFKIIDSFLRSPASKAEDTVVELLRPLNDSSCLQEWLSMNNFLAVLVAEDFGRLEKQFAGSGVKVLVYTLENPRSTIALGTEI